MGEGGRRRTRGGGGGGREEEEEEEDGKRRRMRRTGRGGGEEEGKKGGGRGTGKTSKMGKREKRWWEGCKLLKYIKTASNRNILLKVADLHCS